ncbi:aldo/keto reductase [Lacticaseibacillus thailandensis]|uniref:Oxidoreductase n=1 Tax=Lacticaseibacillus thailandensis DSM 22698 = JCM 13996 TaxID=1423810 RepID=A0A0R2C7I5_9LACO|nr:aldo/keto reductase [Lacticaseibacillus thailandensis]KRM86962.1 oxidoreductase [Lacticaseibacillus thailandensis DSM 22698 = JCM 13996]
MTKLNDVYTLANGVQIPKVGFGTWQIAQDDAQQAVTNALNLGYRLIDTALVYGNERQVGAGIAASDVARADIFVTSKLPAETKTYDGTLRDFDQTMNNLGLDYLDLYLIHAPRPWSSVGADYDNENQDVWRAMQKIYASGRVKAIGVSNFNVHDLQNLLTMDGVAPMVDQIQYYVGYTEPDITSFAQQHDLLVEAYSPLATGALLRNQSLQAIAQRYDVSLAQLAIQFCVQNGVVPLPKATSRAHIEANTHLDFTISDADMVTLNQLRDTAAAWHFN